MFTIKAEKDGRTIIRAAESFTILHTNRGATNQPSQSWSEITLHNAEGGERLDVGDSPYEDCAVQGHLGVFRIAYIMNDKGKIVETIFYGIGQQRAA